MKKIVVETKDGDTNRRIGLKGKPGIPYSRKLSLHEAVGKFVFDHQDELGLKISLE